MSSPVTLQKERENGACPMSEDSKNLVAKQVSSKHVQTVVFQTLLDVVWALFMFTNVMP